jgi:hypothetical protein
MRRQRASDQRPMRHGAPHITDDNDCENRRRTVRPRSRAARRRHAARRDHDGCSSRCAVFVCVVLLMRGVRSEAAARARVGRV